MPLWHPPSAAGCRRVTAWIPASRGEAAHGASVYANPQLPRLATDPYAFVIPVPEAEIHAATVQLPAASDGRLASLPAMPPWRTAPQ